jgi:Protein of unknown function (DUF3285)
MDTKPVETSKPAEIPKPDLPELKSSEPKSPELKTAEREAAEPKDSYVKLAMRNMVRKSRQSLLHFALTTLGLLGVLVGLAYLTR